MAEIVLLAIGIAACLGIIVRDAQEFAVLAPVAPYRGGQPGWHRSKSPVPAFRH
jgi:hypothetical protein